MRPFFLSCAAALLLAGCSWLTAATPPPSPPPQQLQPEAAKRPPAAEMFFPGFSVVRAGRDSSYASLAREHLGDATLAWQVERFNGGEAVTAGSFYLVPHRPFDRGGFREGGLQAVPVISYHKFTRGKGGTMTVSARQFAAQMEHLDREGYVPVGLDALFDFLDFRGDLPDRAVVITFDDGWRSVYEIAYPILRRHGFTATLFVTAGMISGSSQTLSWDQIAEMAGAGFDVQSHSVNHRDLTKMHAGEDLSAYLKDVERELTVSAALIEEKTGRRVRYFAYPYGNTNHLVVAMLKKAGYRGGLTVERGPSPFYVSNYRVGRSMIYGDFTLHDFRKNLETFMPLKSP